LSTGIHTVSAIETILDKDRYTLEEILEEDEVLQVLPARPSCSLWRFFFASFFFFFFFFFFCLFVF
jgi:hypothetical protein